jgi:hypothetical protein
MGSFTSTKKIVKEDTQDADVIDELTRWPENDSACPGGSTVWRRRLMTKCKEELDSWPDLIERKWRKVRIRDTLGENDLDDDFSTVHQNASETSERAPSFRLMQWNVLSQCENISCMHRFQKRSNNRDVIKLYQYPLTT